jgi:hypothetical protein
MFYLNEQFRKRVANSNEEKYDILNDVLVGPIRQVGGGKYKECKN